MVWLSVGFVGRESRHRAMAAAAVESPPRTGTAPRVHTRTTGPLRPLLTNGSSAGGRSRPRSLAMPVQRVSNDC